MFDMSGPSLSRAGFWSRIPSLTIPLRFDLRGKYLAIPNSLCRHGNGMKPLISDGRLRPRQHNSFRYRLPIHRAFPDDQEALKQTQLLHRRLRRLDVADHDVRAFRED